MLVIICKSKMYISQWDRGIGMYYYPQTTYKVLWYKHLKKMVRKPLKCLE